jgi:broad specificity phosphatase PhoE
MLILVRHGQSLWNAEGRLAGRADPPLTELGQRQAAATGRHLAAERAAAPGPPPRVLASPLERALRTAELIAAALDVPEVVVDAQLVELDYGELDGTLLAEVDRAQWQQWREDVAWRPPGGETLLELHERIRVWCEGIAEAASEGDVVAVTHVSPVKAAAGWAIGAGPEVSWRMSLAVSSVTRVSTSPRSLHSFGETAHLAGLG